MPPPHRPYGDPQVTRDLADLVVTGEPPGGLQTQPLAPLPPGGRVPAPLRIPPAPAYDSTRPASLPPTARNYEFNLAIGEGTQSRALWAAPTACCPHAM